MRGFFDLKKMERPKGPDKHNCQTCGLHSKCNSPQMPYSGKGGKGILIIAEAPGETEDNEGRQLVGSAGRLLNEKLNAIGFDLDRDFYKINAINCRPPGNRKPTNKEIKCCRSRVQAVIDEFKPRFIWLMGAVALDSFYTNTHVDPDDLLISSWRGRCVPDKDTGAWIIPLFHPSFVLQNRDPILEKVFGDDLKWAVSCLNRKPPVFRDYEKDVTLLTDYDETRQYLEGLLHVRKPEKMVFDYETSGLKPYREGHKIYTISVSEDLGETSYSFPFQYPHWKRNQFDVIRGLWSEILECGLIGKIAHNIKFEHKWSRHVIGVEPKNWVMDTMVLQHLVDSRPKLTRLKVQVLLRWGVQGYDRVVKPYIKSAEDSLSFNKLHMVSMDELLLYCGFDSLFEGKLAGLLPRELRGYNKEIIDLFHEGLSAFIDAEEEGLTVNMDYYEEEEKRIIRVVGDRFRELKSSEEAIKFKEVIGREMDLGAVAEIKTSSKDLGILFYDVLKMKPTKFTKLKKAPSVDEEALEKMDSSFATKILKTRKLQKVKDTYIAQFKREAHDGRIRPNHNLHTVETGRSSSDDPNLHNIPVREEEARESVRRGIIPKPGFEFIEVDYGGIEVRVMACYSKDPVLVKYIKDPTSDMHRDQAKNIFYLSDKQVTKDLRYHAKGGFVFAQFYGDYYKGCARNLWGDSSECLTGDKVPIREHLINKGVKSYKDFEEHIRHVEKKFWDLLWVTDEWRKEAAELYLRKGYIESFHGFRRKGYLNRKQIMNSPIQGTAFHCLLWSYIRLNNLRKKEGWKSTLHGQIHDSIIFNVWPEERDYVLKTIKRVMCDDIREAHPWIIVPFDVEFESSLISWADIKEIKV